MLGQDKALLYEDLLAFLQDNHAMRMGSFEPDDNFITQWLDDRDIDGATFTVLWSGAIRGTYTEADEDGSSTETWEVHLGAGFPSVRGLLAQVQDACGDDLPVTGCRVLTAIGVTQHDDGRNPQRLPQQIVEFAIRQRLLPNPYERVRPFEEPACVLHTAQQTLICGIVLASSRPEAAAQIAPLIDPAQRAAFLTSFDTLWAGCDGR